MTDVIVIGAGIVGLACAWAALREGARVTLVDRDFEGDRASHGNAGGIAVTESTPIAVHGMFTKAAKWLMDPLGPLALDWKHVPKALPWFMAFRRASEPARFRAISHALSLLNNRVYDDILPMFDDIGASAMLYRRGALTVYETDAAFAADQPEWSFKRELGARWHALSAQQVRECEPSLAPVFRHGVFLDDWSHIGDPRRIVTLLRERVRALGARFVTGIARAIDAPESVVLDDGTRVNGRRIVIAAGAWSAALARSIGDSVLLESERGYNATLPKHGVALTREVIFAERKFVATPLDIGLRIGGAAEFAGIDAPPNYRRSDALLELGKRFIQGIDDTDAVKWMGHRPATPDSLPVIGASPRMPSVVHAFGHGHLGLTQSATTAALVADVLAGRTPRVPLTPYSIARF
ncbi:MULTISPECIES: FAD-dependent oxidoreductase [Caballeronia]|jgi:D-amino-acid dehydrogenase|uniref:Amino acid dehydrogenase n=1 Tax=Caballeronia zhejiangensis TaxID=871203 RepID=A0A656QHW0_9BURK|nr:MULTISPECIES: FAD-dependent oxidoreductase [Caballeronia]EKS69479.1 D-amino-acid dehydrogenase [Burkholderia sp. SJ98]KDR29651.1 amino acid dehydrogenase [Caballeronia zhejiangensis]MDR5767069.1 FAD-dependent oxidoreductase [Caballeronia sp. LZ028]MDR5791159.1 FAD-dependent oxidoreductase [Caballeronia sp. LP003]